MSGLDNEKMKTKQNNNKRKEPKALKAFHEVKFKKSTICEASSFIPTMTKEGHKYVTDLQNSGWMILRVINYISYH